jgi:hypothetical protein
MTVHAAKKLKAQFDQAENYVVYRLRADTFYVKRKFYKDPPTGFHDERFHEYIVPKYERTRTIAVRQGAHLPGNLFLHCSCG